MKKKITKKTKAIIPVHLYGNPVDLDKIVAICKENKLYLIEDACQAHGSEYKGKKLGTFGEIGCFSFYPTKNLGAMGDGGLITTSNAKIASGCKVLRDYGQSKKYIHVSLGLNSRLDELQAAILNVKLAYLDKFNSKRRKLAEGYKSGLTGLPVYIIWPENFGKSNFHQFVITTKKRDQLQKYLLTKSIPTLIHYPKIIPDQPVFNSQYSKQSFPVSRSFVKETLSLPCNPTMTFKEVKFITKSIQTFFF